MTPRRHNMSVHSLLYGMGLLALITLHENVVHAATPPPQALGSSRVVNPEPISFREQETYKHARVHHREELAHTDRADIPQAMLDFPPPPNRAEEEIFTAWIAERDALIDRALALGYEIGKVRDLVFEGSSWRCNGVNATGEPCFHYRISSRITRHSPEPQNGDAILLNRNPVQRFDMSGQELPSFTLIPRHFIHDPALG